MIFDPDDPRLTAYALGELEGDDRTSVETLIQQNEEARQFVDETRRLAGLLRESLRTEPVSGLDPSHRDAIAAHLDGPSQPVPSRRIPWRPLGLAAAATVAIGGGTLAFYIGRTAPADRPRAVNDLLFARASTPEPAVAHETPSIHVTERGTIESAEAPPAHDPQSRRMVGANIQREFFQDESGQVASDDLTNRMGRLSETPPTSAPRRRGVDVRSETLATTFRTHGGLGPEGILPAAPAPSELASAAKPDQTQPRQKAQSGQQQGSSTALDVMRKMDNYNVFLPTGDARFGTTDYAIDKDSMLDFAKKSAKPQSEAAQPSSRWSLWWGS